MDTETIEYNSHKIYGFDFSDEDYKNLETSILNNCIAKKGDVLFDVHEIARRINKDAFDETGDNTFFAIAYFISLMFMQALCEDELNEDLKFLLRDYIFKNKKHYNFKFKNTSLYRKMYKNCACYPATLFFLILENTKSNVLGEPLFLEYGSSMFCKTHYLKPTEDGTTLIDCDAEDAKWAAGVYITPEEEAKIERHIKRVNEICDRMRAEGKTHEEIHLALQKMREEGTLCEKKYSIEF